MINGEYLKSIRKKEKITLSSLSSDIGCTASYLSQIERGLREPSLPMLRKLSESLNIPMVSLISPANPESEAAENNSFHITYANQRNVIYLPQLKTKSEVFTPQNSDCSMRGIIHTTPPGYFSSEGMIYHTYDECMFILEGTANAYVENDVFNLKKGDSIYIHSNTKHNIQNSGTDDLVIIAFSDCHI